MLTRRVADANGIRGKEPLVELGVAQDRDLRRPELVDRRAEDAQCFCR